MRNFRNSAPVILAFLLLTNMVYTVNAESGITMELETGYVSGLSKEYVYSFLPPKTLDGYPYTNNYGMLSRLDWDIAAPSESFEIALKLSGFIARANFLVAIPYLKGKMQDRDWSWLDDRKQTVVTGFSEHTAALDHGFDFTGGIGYQFDLPANFSIRPEAGLLYKKYKWIARDGYGRYTLASSPENPGYTYREFAGPVVAYSQSYYLPYIGAALGYNLFFGRAGGDEGDVKAAVAVKKPTKLEFELTGKYFPKMTITAIDDHLLRSITFKDEMDGFMDSNATGVNGSFSIWLHPGFIQNWAFGATVGAEYIASPFGKEYIRTANSNKYTYIRDSESRVITYDFSAYIGAKYQIPFGKQQ
jgi:outer membrane protease